MYRRLYTPPLPRPFKYIKHILLILCCVITLRESTAQPSLEALNPPLVSFNFVANGTSLTSDADYINPFGERYQVRTLMFYISRIRLSHSVDTNTGYDEKYHLIDFSHAASHTFSVKAPKGTYDTIQFMLGVDSFHNTNGAQAGALDPLHGMFWTWNSGYIFAKFEGLWARSSGIDIPFAHHVGGFRPGEDAQRLVLLTLPPHRIIEVKEQHNPRIEITVEVSRWFNGKHALSLAEYPTVMTPGAKSMLVADNVSTIFSVQ
jgi:hypothetical protein